MAFYVGQKVARYRACPGYEELNPPPMNKEVTISWIREVVFEGETLTVIDLIEYPSPTVSSVPEWQRGWAAEYFRPIVSRPTSISIFTAMLGPTKVRGDA